MNICRHQLMAPSIFSSSPKLILRLISIFKPPISVRTITTTTTFTAPSSPCLMLPPTFVGENNMIYNFYNLAQNKVLNFNTKKLEDMTRAVGSSHGWLAQFNEHNSDLTLTNPITGRHIKLPPNKSNVSSFVKIILSCDADQEDCLAMRICNFGKLSFCRPNHNPSEWTHIGKHRCRGLVRCYEDVVYSSRHKLFFCATGVGIDDLQAWDVASDPPSLVWQNTHDLLGLENYLDFIWQHENLLIDDNGERRYTERFKYLVVFVDQLFLVTRHIVRRMAPDGSSTDEGGYDDYPCKTVSFNVHKIEWELEGGGRLSHMDGGSLDGLAMFIGRNHSFGVLASESNGLKPNSIYFTNDKEFTPRDLSDRKYGGHDIGIFDYETKTISPCYYPCDVKRLKKIAPEPIWFTPTFS
ncbi:hypothetical protein CASFOL_009092 [Castilleja foliolosa]|uniref:KIB1-4 beta-propeller domain-containing protein n=1 Tax=Castilleja foliolosa TaxID=1961234 RepID=A0ABD3E4X1_9LAMI